MARPAVDVHTPATRVAAARFVTTMEERAPGLLETIQAQAGARTRPITGAQRRFARAIAGYSNDGYTPEQSLAPSIRRFEMSDDYDAYGVGRGDACASDPHYRRPGESAAEWEARYVALRQRAQAARIETRPRVRPTRTNSRYRVLA